MATSRAISLSYWPAFYEGELLYSAIARFGRYTRVVSAEVLNECFFNSKTARHPIDLPTKIEYLSSQLPRAQNCSPLIIIKNHTLYNYYAAFYEHSDRQKLFRYMSSSGYKVRRSYFSRKSPVGLVTHLRFCPKCRDAMIEKYGEAHWRREHQIPTVRVCIEHEELLSTSTVAIDGSARRYIPLTEETETADVGRSGKDISDQGFDQLIRIARTSIGCIKGENIQSPKDLYVEYRSILRAKGFARSAKSRISNVLLEEAANNYADKLFDVWPHITSANHDQEKWFKIPIRTRYCRTHPAYHILFDDFIKHLPSSNVENVPSRLRDLSIDWPCCNPLIIHSNKPSVKLLQYRRTKAGTRMRFECECGCIYNRTQNHDGIFGRPIILSYGPAMIDLLNKATREGWSASMICDKFNITRAIIYSQARKLGLSFSSAGPRPSRNGGSD